MGASDSQKEKKPIVRGAHAVDTTNIDCWAIPEWTKEMGRNCLFDETSFATLYPQYRQQYLQEVWPDLEVLLKRYGIKATLDITEGSMTVRTTKKAWDPYAIIKARDLIKLLARSVPFKQAQKIMDDGMLTEIVKIGNLVRNREKFVKRRLRLIGPNGSTLKALEKLTNTFILVQGHTVCVMGDHKGLKTVHRIVHETFQNVHPVYAIKELMIKKELAKNEDLKNESWDNYLPQFKKVRESRKKGAERRKKMAADQEAKKKRSVFPNAPTPRKEDLQMESGEYFLSEKEKVVRDRKKKVEDQMAKKKISQANREKLFDPANLETLESQSSKPKKRKAEVSMAELSSSMAKIKKKAKKH